MIQNAAWIRPAQDLGDVCPVFIREFRTDRPVAAATLTITALGVYEAGINGTRVGSFVLAPGWTTYAHRLQYQTYDVTALLSSSNRIEVLVGKGWYRSRLVGWEPSAAQAKLQENPAGLLVCLDLCYADGTKEQICSDESWQVQESQIRFSEIYDGEICDATFAASNSIPAVTFDGPDHTLIPQQGPEIREQERVSAASVFVTPKKETVLDFGQEITGYVEVNVNANAGDIADLSFAEVMDKEGNFYTENYRSAKAQYHYICRDGAQTYRTRLTFYGFRYLRINAFPGGAEHAKPEQFTAIVLHSDIRRTGSVRCSNAELNRLFENVIWGQKGNFLDVPTDCPQRDERLGWTGDAQVFCKAACYNFDVEQFFTKWLADMAADQHEDGYVGHVIPDLLQAEPASAAWGDAAAICPWEVYLTYGDPAILNAQFDCMRRWVDYITAHTTTEYLWTGGTHYGDWLGLDAPSGSYKGSSREEFIASAFYAYSASLVIKAGHVLGRDVSSFETLLKNITETFRRTYPDYRTQTECVLAAHFGLAPDPQAAADQLADMVISCGTKLQTGFVGTPYLLHVLSSYGHADLAYSLLLRREYPSWLYPVTKGATTIWEHWDGIMESGDFWSADMNSYNHYAYGAVADWMYGVAAGIRPDPDAPGYEKVIIAPVPDARLEWFEASFDSRHGQIRSRWTRAETRFCYEITTPVDAEIVIAGTRRLVGPGTYLFYSAR